MFSQVRITAWYTILWSYWKLKSQQLPFQNQGCSHMQISAEFAYQYLVLTWDTNIQSLTCFTAPAHSVDNCACSLPFANRGLCIDTMQTNF